MKSSLTILAALALLAGVAERVKADLVINLANPSFESPDVGAASSGAFSVDVITSWMTNASGSFGVYNPIVGGANETIVGSVPDGKQVAYLNTVSSIGQDTGTTVVAGDTYSLTFSVAPRADFTATEGWSAQLFTASNPTVAFGTLTGSVTDGGGAGFQTQTLTAAAPVGSSGDLIVRFSGTTPGSGQVLFDKVSLTDTSITAVPEPSTLGLAATGTMLGLGALRRSRRRAITN